MESIWSRKALHLAIDIEAFDHAPTACIATIGVLIFSPFAVTPYESPTWYKRIDWHDNDQKERTTDQATLEWWGAQGAGSRFEVYHAPDRMPLRDALFELQGAILHYKREHLRETGCGEICVWSNGANYDSSILLHAFKQYRLEAPWTFRDAMDARTLRHIAGTVEVDTKGLTPHIALDDAILCSRRVTAQLARLKSNTTK